MRRLPQTEQKLTHGCDCGRGNFVTCSGCMEQILREEQDMALEWAAQVAEGWAHRNLKNTYPEEVIMTARHASKDIALLIRVGKRKHRASDTI
jgi:hypothetical protein